jgi:hypothetical protein
MATAKIQRAPTCAESTEWPTAPECCNLLLMPTQTRETSLEELEKLAEKGCVYVILDACDAPAVPKKARNLGEGLAVSLYNGTAQEDYWAIAPYLCRADGKLLQWVKASLWKEPWGIVVIATADFAAVRAHFRKFLVVQSPEREYWYFRFYDPRVLPVFLESSNEDELKEFFGPVQAYAVHSPEEMKLRLIKAI